MSTGKQQRTNGRGNRDSATIDIDQSPPVSHTDVPPPAYSSTPERGLGRPNDHGEQAPLLGSDRVTLGRVATPAEAAARRATEPGSRRRGGGDGEGGVGCFEGLRQWRDDAGQRLGWWWEDRWQGKVFLEEDLLSFESKTTIGTNNV